MSEVDLRIGERTIEGNGIWKSEDVAGCSKTTQYINIEQTAEFYSLSMLA